MFTCAYLSKVCIPLTHLIHIILNLLVTLEMILPNSSHFGVEQTETQELSAFLQISHL